MIEPVERPVARSERRVSFPKINFGSLCGLTLMLQGLIMFISLLSGNSLITDIVLAIAAGGFLVVGFKVARRQSALSVRLALYASLFGLLLCFVGLLGWFGTLTIVITAPTGIVLFAVSAVLAGLELRKLRVHQPSDAGTFAPTTKQASRQPGDFIGTQDFARSLALLLIFQAIITLFVFFGFMSSFLDYITALLNVFSVGFVHGFFEILNFLILTQLVQIFTGVILLARGYSKNFRTTLFCVGVANLVSSSFVLCFPFVVNKPAIPTLYLPAAAAFMVAFIACVWSVWVGRLKTS